jgi:hypothetical protein
MYFKFKKMKCREFFEQHCTLSAIYIFFTLNSYLLPTYIFLLLVLNRDFSGYRITTGNRPARLLQKDCNGVV